MRRAVIEVIVPAPQHMTARAGVRVHRRLDTEGRRHPTRVPPQTRMEDTVLDLLEQCRPLDQGIATIARACATRVTTPQRIADRAGQRKKLSRRRELAQLLVDVSAGAHSVLEVRYLWVVERPSVTGRDSPAPDRPGWPQAV
ncbi:MAG: hypothetical protein L0Y54_14835 [Sporichthyaceae bacterium]|nr:hypothetical protein [Sporichthyaceae bacterium]